MENKNKKLVLVDLDGVLNVYEGNFNYDYIPEIKHGAKDFLAKMSKRFVVKIFTTRNKILTVKWLIENDVEKYVEDVTSIKEPAFLYVDDRCIQFQGDFENIFLEIEQYSPYYKFDLL